MTSTITDLKCIGVAEKLAQIRAFQKLLIANEHQTIGECSDSEICDRLQKMLADNHNNLRIVETLITAYRIQSKPPETVQEMARQPQSIIKGSELTLQEKGGS